MKNFLVATGLFFLCLCSASAQSYIGYSVDNYNGVHGLILNPASVVDSKVRSDINLFSLSLFAGSDYFGLDIQNALESLEGDGFTFDDQIKKFPKDDNQFFMNIDVVGPSFMFNLNRKNSIGIITRLRGFMNLNNLNGKLYESLQEDFDTRENFDFELRDFSGTIHYWAEIGLAYGRVLMDKNSNFLKGGLTLKYYQGAGANFLNAPSASGFYDAENMILTTEGTLSYGQSSNFDGNDIDFSNLSSGFGADIGFVYEYRPNPGVDEELKNVDHSHYKFKLGVALTDIGSITYSESTVNKYILDNSISRVNFVENDFDIVLDENFGGSEEAVETEINLPTAVNVLADYKFRKRVYLAVQGSLSLVETGKEQANRILNSVTAIPRYESKWFSFYLPVGIRQYDGLTLGTGLRLGALSLGSGSVISNYISDEAGTTDFYVGLKIPIYR